MTPKNSTVDKQISEQRTPISFSKLQESVEQWLLLKDKGILRILVATILANKLKGDPVWLLIVCASGGSKTELLRGLSKIPNIYYISDLTAQTFLSGQKGENASLLNKLHPHDTILIMKDFTTVLSMNRDKRAEILAQLREIYDGFYQKDFGTGENKSWNGKIGFIGGVTTIIDQHQSVFQVLGERFVQYHLKHEDALTLARRAIKNTGDEIPMREEIQKAFADFISGIKIPETNPEISDEVQEKVAHLATFCVLARSGVIREGKSSRDIEFIPDAELPTRLTKELLQLISGLSLIDYATDKENYSLIYKIGFDSIPQKRRRIIQMMNFGNQYETREIANTIKYPLSSTMRSLEELEALGLLKRSKETPGKSHWWSFTDYAVELLKIASPIQEKEEDDTSPDMSEGDVVRT